MPHAVADGESRRLARRGGRLSAARALVVRVFYVALYVEQLSLYIEHEARSLQAALELRVEPFRVGEEQPVLRQGGEVQLRRLQIRIVSDLPGAGRDLFRCLRDTLRSFRCGLPAALLGKLPRGHLRKLSRPIGRLGLLRPQAHLTPYAVHCRFHVLPGYIVSKAGRELAVALPEGQPQQIHQGLAVRKDHQCTHIFRVLAVGHGVGEGTKAL